ncbi:hypothetical protein STEG23_028786 [Scotinomys teguina]
MQPGRTTNTGGGTIEVVAAAPRCQLLLILVMSAVMLLPGTNSSLLLVQRTVTRTIMLQETIGKDEKNPFYIFDMYGFSLLSVDIFLYMSDITQIRYGDQLTFPHNCLAPEVFKHVVLLSLGHLPTFRGAEVTGQLYGTGTGSILVALAELELRTLGRVANAFIN